MLCIKTQVKKSNIPNAGKGLFSLDFAPKGSVIFLPITGSTIDRVILEEPYREELTKSDNFPLNAGMRWGGHYFLCCSQNPDKADYINHANNPNLLSCLGFFFALHDIHCGDELTLDYKYLELAKEASLQINEQEKIIGLSAKEALFQSAKELINLLNEVEDIHCFDLPGKPD
ncbi:SET domain-containing protein-lysine N-methyltransferase [Anabaena sp. WFMT]|uniref:SET domain-containing protein-lysine N-methyltransferase n=1 Tax=Anabaena sp. WFMT TaxID=3449730 RepID=UPI003F1E69BA